MLTAQEYWKKTPLTNVEALVAQYNELAKDSELSDLYSDDAKDFAKAIELFRADDPETLSEFVTYMDTAPREALVVAFWRDCGDMFVEEHLGFTMNKNGVAA